MANPYYFSEHWRSLRAERLQLDGYRCVVPGCKARAVIVDHIETRPQGLPIPCALDRLANLRSLCSSHDSQIKEFRGVRKQSGTFRVKGCDAEGRSLDPGHRWRG
jgi:hypothetical protein